MGDKDINLEKELEDYSKRVKVRLKEITKNIYNKDKKDEQ